MYRFSNSCNFLTKIDFCDLIEDSESPGSVLFDFAQKSRKARLHGISEARRHGPEKLMLKVPHALFPQKNVREANFLPKMEYLVSLSPVNSVFAEIQTLHEKLQGPKNAVFRGFPLKSDFQKLSGNERIRKRSACFFL